jgi:hypothetical protein
MELEIKNNVKMFEPKTLKHAYNLARLQANTLSYRKSPSYVRKPAILCTNPTANTPPTFPQHTTRNPTNSQANSSQPPQLNGHQTLPTIYIQIPVNLPNSSGIKSLRTEG